MDVKKKLNEPSTYFGDWVFNDRTMRTRLSRQTYLSLKATIEEGHPLEPDLAAEVAVAMKQWAVELGATHFTHWFMPMTGLTAEKHDSFIDALPDGQVILNFSAKALIKGEPDASSFPTGGIRETSAARGYTAWDCTSPAFVKEGTLYIPTAFYSHTGEVLDKRAPLLRSIQALSQQGVRLLHALGDHKAKRVNSTIGPEQEYFLVDRELYLKRPDLMNCGRTLFGARPPKGQEFSDAYYASLHPRVLAFMQELDETLWHLGITAKTRHNEVAPTQHELAIIFDPASVAADHNMLVMEMMKKIARKHQFECLLHEKPYRYLNGSGKHINWSIATDSGENLLEPGKNPQDNTRFLLFLAAVITAVDRYGDYLTLSVASAPNERRLGTQEAPPAILSMAIGDQLQDILEAIMEDRPYISPEKTYTNLGVSSMSVSTVDTTDRNRTSPFAFTGNRFEFRMCGSQANIAGPCFILNTVVAKVFSDFADQLEGAPDVELAARELVRESMKRHSKVIYAGDNYAPHWPEEAKRRGLAVASDAVDAISHMADEAFIQLFDELGVLSPMESISRHDILLDNYRLVVHAECQTALDIFRRLLRPAVYHSMGKLSQDLMHLEQMGLKQAEGRRHLAELSDLCQEMERAAQALELAVEEAKAVEALSDQARAYHDLSQAELDQLRAVVDQLEQLIPAEDWPMPTYRELLVQR